MNNSRYEIISNKILSDETLRYSEIYKITNILNGKIYVGQCVSHILNHRKYRPYGYMGRFKTHISEAFSMKKNQSHYLNNSIRKYGPDKFNVELIAYCELEKSDERETYYIHHLNSIYPNGYNLKIGGSSFKHSDESKKRLSVGVSKYYADNYSERIEKFKKVKHIDDDIDKYIKPLNRNNTQYGWYVYIERCKTDFGGVHIPLEKSKESAIEFIQLLKIHLAKHLDAGNPLESQTTTS
jgi:group I intron endonuclease